MHKTLDRQLKKYFGSLDTPPKEWEKFLSIISDTYAQYDDDRSLIERSLEISSKEHIEYAEKLRQSEQLFRTLIEVIPDIIVRFDKNLKIIFISQSVKESIGQSPEQFIGKNDEELPLPPDIITLWNSKLTEVFTTKKSTTFEFTLTSGDTHRLFENRIVPEIATDGTVQTVVAVIRDITEQKASSDALRVSEERFQAFMENNPAVAWMKDAEGKFLYINSVFGKRFNISLESIRGKTDYDIFPKEIADAVRTNDQKVRESGKPMEIEETIPTPDGVARVWLTYKFPFTDLNKKQLIGGMAIDITDQKIHQAALDSRSKELELINKAMVGRELKMVELKETVQKLKARLGEA
jgi:PAS domain S-box-containing protein